ncbi:thioredoxin family protein [soil metagenome]
MTCRNTVLALLTAAALGVTFSSAVMAAPEGEMKDPKAMTPKHEMKEAAVAKVGEKAPEFSLTDTDGKTVKLSDLLADKSTKAVVIEWFNPECPFVKKQYEKNTTMPDTYKMFKDKGVKWVAINSGAAGKEGAGKDVSAKAKASWKIEYPILIDESGVVGMAYGAKHTPTMYIVNKDGTLAYAGGIDNNKSMDKPGDKNYIKLALEDILAGKKVATANSDAYGCSVKYAEAKK